MRSSFAVLALTAFGAYARPQESVTGVQPITQISDGQIQAPPATAPPASYGTPSVIETATPSLTDIEITPTVTEAPVEPTVPVESPPVDNSSVVVVVPTGSGNATVSIGTPTASASETPEESATGTETAAPSAPESTGAAAANMASMGALALAVLGMVIA